MHLNTVDSELYFDADDQSAFRLTNNGVLASLASGLAGSIQFSDGTSFTSDNSNLFWDNTNKRLGIGTATPNHTIHVIGTAGLSTSATWTNTSDERLKDIHGPYTKGLLEISQLQPVIFNYKKNNPQNLPSDVEITGFIAQQVQPIFPEAISTGADGYLNFNIHPINIAMINAVKELKLQNDSLKTENEKLKSEISAIKTYLCKQDPTSTLCEN